MFTSIATCFNHHLLLTLLTCGSIAFAAESSAFRPYDFPATPSMTEAKITAQATGFFRVEKINGRWWLIDPKGRGDVFIGINGGAGLRWNDGFSKNLLEHYGSEAHMRDVINGHITNAGFNASGGDGGESYRLMVNDGCKVGSEGKLMPHASLLDLSDASARHGADANDVNIHPEPYKPGGSDWHFWVADPFHPSFAEGVEAYAKRLCAPNRGNPWLIGYFLDNERAWQSTQAVLEAIMRKPATQPGKLKLVELAKQRFADVAAFNRAFIGTVYASIDELANATVPPLPATADGQALYDAWGEAFYDTWFGTAVRIIKKYDPDHLILGTREMGGWNGDDRHLFAASGRYCDVVSVNDYVGFDWQANVPAIQIARWKHLSELANNKPLIISEYNIQAADGTKNHTSVMVPTSKEKVSAHRIYSEAILAQPFMLGSMWFQLYNEDQDFGILDDQWNPRQTVIDAMRATHARAAQVHTGTIPAAVRGSPTVEKWQPKLPPVIAGDSLNETVGNVHYTLNQGRIEIRQGERYLGRFQPWIHQWVPGNRWPETTTASVAERRQNDIWTVVDVRFARPADAGGHIDAGAGVAPPPDQRTFAPFTVTYRLWFPRQIAAGSNAWFLSQNIAIRNDDRQAIFCGGVFPLVHPDGNQQTLTIPFGRSIQESAWIFKDTNLALITAAPLIGDTKFQAPIWFMDGNPHPSENETIARLLAPGETLIREGLPILHAVTTVGSDGEVYPAINHLYADVRRRIGLSEW